MPVTINKLQDDFAFAPGKQAVGGEHKTRTEPKITYEAKKEPEQVIHELEQQKPAEVASPVAEDKPKRGRKPKVLVIQEEIPLQVENIQENPVAPIKKRGRPKKVV